eukprot:TRINITY_DN14593_c0_g1_i1.p1 TRINITY_DN14593_c0_g1~~TRINITY_DN14593_c0_g1_i1.p1  ORF type:complete len:379 (-),score=81.43 TRINITY_DN14593_c0_g1_i1:192-1304(-)
MASLPSARNSVVEEDVIIEHAEGRREVGISSIFGITSIRDVEQTFRVDIVFYFHWPESLTEAKIRAIESGGSHGDAESSASSKRTKVEGFQKLLAKPNWVPHMSFYNFESFELADEVYFFDESQAMYYASLNYAITFLEPFELHRFPFDRQSMRIGFGSTNSKLVPYNPKYGYPPGFLDDCVIYGIYKYDNWIIDEIKSEVVSDENEVSFYIKIFATRRADFYIYNICAVVFLIVLCAATVQAIDVHDFPDRMSVTITLLLTAVAFKFVTNSYIPQVSYLTLLDKYTMFSFVMLSSVVLENYLITHLSRDNARDVDNIFTVVFVALWLLIHFVIGVGNRFNFFHQSWERVLSTDNSQVTRIKKKSIDKMN